MAYRKRYSSYGYNTSGYGRYKPDAYYVDGGANDEGYNWRYCCTCSEETEHDLSTCLQCNCVNAEK